MENNSPGHDTNTMIRWTIWIVGAAALAYLVIEHRPHLFGWLPYLIILACPLTHLFMHRGHGHHRGGENRPRQDRHAS